MCSTAPTLPARKGTTLKGTADGRNAAGYAARAPAEVSVKSVDNFKRIEAADVVKPFAARIAVTLLRIKDFKKGAATANLEMTRFPT